MSVEHSPISLRPAGEQDCAFRCRVYQDAHGAALAGLPAALLEMQVEAQTRGYLTEFPAAVQLIISRGSTDCGILWISENREEIRILDVSVLAEFRNQGIGTEILRYIKECGQIAGKPVRLRVQEGSSAARLYIRLGFESVSTTTPYLAMEWNPDRESPRSVSINPSGLTAGRKDPF